MIIGNFTYDSTTDIYTGEIRTLTTLWRTVVFRPTALDGTGKPDYRILEEGTGGTVEFGAAWKRTSERGQDFISVVLDDPALAAPVNAALFRRAPENTASLVWSRREPKAHEPEPK